MTAPRTKLALPLAAALICSALVFAGCSRNTPESMIESGKAYLAKKDTKSALIQFKAALQADSGSSEARFLLGRALLESGDLAAAVVELSKTLDERYDESQVLPALAKALLLSGSAQKAATLYGNVDLDDRTANADLKSTIALAWGVLGETAKAQQALAAALQSAPDFPGALILQARIKASEGQVDEAVAMVDRVLAGHKDNAEAWNLKGDLLSGPKYEPKAAAAAYQKAVDAEKTFVSAYRGLMALALRAQDLPTAKSHIAKLSAVLPNHPQTMFLAAQIALAERDLKKAREIVQQLARYAPNSVSVLQMAGIIDAATGSLVVAETSFSKALQIETDLPFARRSLAKVYLQMGDPSKALRTVQSMIGPQALDAEALSLAGEAQLQLGDARAAELLFLQAAKLTPNDPRLRTALALLTLSNGDTAGAFAQLDTISRETQDTAAEMAIFSARMRRREYDEAARAVDAMEKKRPGDAGVYELRASVALAHQDYASARQDLDKAFAIQPSRYSVIATLVSIDLREGKPEAARKRLAAAVSADPRNHLARMAQAEVMARQGVPLSEIRQVLADGVRAAPSEPAPRVRLIDLLLSRRQYSDALAVAQEATATLPNDPDLLDTMGRAQQLAGDSQQAVSTFRKLASVEPKSARANLRLADLYVATGNSDGAMASLRHALEIEPNQEAAKTRLIDLLLVKGQSKPALDMARSMVRESPSSPVGYLLEGAIQRRLKATDSALEVFRTGLRLNKDSAQLAIEFHKALIQKARLPEADSFAAEWSKSHPANADFEYYLGLVYIARGDLEKADMLLTSVHRVLPDNPLVLNNLAWVMAKRGKPGAVALAQRAVDLTPNAPALLDTLALTLATDGQTAKALEVQKKAIAVAPGDLGLRLNLARIALQAGDKALARSELERLASMGTKLPYHAMVTKMLKSL